MLAAARAERFLGLSEAATHYRRALQVAAVIEEPQPDLVLTLTIKLGEVLNGIGDPQSRELLLRAAAMAREAADPAALAKVALAMIRYGGLPAYGADPEFVAIVEEALVALGREPSALRARALAALSEDVTFTDPDRALELLREAVNIAERLGDPETLGHVLLAYRLAGKTPGNADAGHPTANRLITLGRQTGHTPFVLHGLVQRAWTFREEGDLASADRAMTAARSFLGDEPAPVYAALFTAVPVVATAARRRPRSCRGGGERSAQSRLGRVRRHVVVRPGTDGHPRPASPARRADPADRGRHRRPCLRRLIPGGPRRGLRLRRPARRGTPDPHHLFGQRLPGRPPQPTVAHRHDRARRDRRDPRPPSGRRGDRRAAPPVRRANRRPVVDRRHDRRPRPRTDGTRHRRPPARTTARRAGRLRQPQAQNPALPRAASCSDSPQPASTSANPRTPPTTSYTRRLRSPTEPARRSSSTRPSRLGLLDATMP